jgi:prevent-host-death family protein
MSEHGDSHTVVQRGGETAVLVPVDEYRMLTALRDRASAEEIEMAETDAAIAEHEAWKAAGRPGGTIPHGVAMGELLGGQ